MSSISSALASLFAPNTVSSASSTTTSSTSTSSSSSSTSYFTGTSAYSQDLQNVVSRAVAIANLPVELLTNQKTALNNQSTELSTLDSLLTTLQSTVTGIQSAMAGSSFTSTVLDSSSNTSTAVAATLTDSAKEGVYSMTVDDLGAYASGLTKNNWSGTSGASYNLVIGGSSHTIKPSANTAASLAEAINQQYGSSVRATVVNVSASDTRIALQAASLGQQTLDLQNSSGTSLFTQNVSGSLAKYTVSGGAQVSTSSRSVEISPGVTLTMNATTSSPVSVTVSRSDSALSSALSTFATAYNAVVDEVTAQRGTSAGPLQGTTILQSISQALSDMATYNSSSGSVSSLYNLGLELNANYTMNGHLTFTSMNLAATDIGNSSDVDSFLGSSSASGFLKSVSDTLSNLLDSSNGLLTNTETAVKNQISDLTNTISTKQAQVTALQTSLTKQMAEADALISEVEQQYSYFNEMFQAQQVEAKLYG